MSYRYGLICAGLVFCCLAIYGQTVGHDFVICDDTLYVTENPEVQAGLSWANAGWAFTTDRAMYMHPLTWMSHMLDCDLYGLRPWGHHLTNLILHALNAILLFLVLARMTGCLWPSALSAALFAVHPLHVESVAWVAERKDLLSMLFWTGGLGAHAWYRQRPGVWRYLATAALFLLGFLSKPMVVTFPFVLLLLDYWPLGRMDFAGSSGARMRQLARLAVEMIPLFLLTAAMCAVTMVMQSRGNNLSFGAQVSLGNRCANAVVVYVIYLVNAAWPFGLAAYYPHPIARPAWEVAGAAVLLAAITLVTLWQMRRRPWLPVGWLWYLGTLVPVIELVQAGTFSHADRYTYIPLIGIFIMLAWSLDELRQSRRVPALAVSGAAAAMVAGLTLAAVNQTAYWKDSETLFRHALEVTPDNVYSRTNYASGLYANKKLDESLAQLRHVLRLDPQNSFATENIALILNDQGHYEEAAARHREALNLYPDYAKARANLRTTLKNMGTLDMITAEHDALAEKKNKTLDDLCRLGALAMTLGNPKEASDAFNQAVRMEPSGRRVNLSIGGVLAEDRQYAKALPFYEKALQADPRDTRALCGLGLVLWGLDRPAEAERLLKKAFEIDPANVDALKLLGKIEADKSSPPTFVK